MDVIFGRRRVGWRWYAAVAVLPGFLAAAAVVDALAGNGWPDPAELPRYSGLPDIEHPNTLTAAILLCAWSDMAEDSST